MRPSMRDVLDHRVGAGKEQSFVPVVVPAHHPRWLAASAVHLEDLGVTVGFADVMSLDHEPIPGVRFHA